VNSELCILNHKSQIVINITDLIMRKKKAARNGGFFYLNMKEIPENR